MRKLVLGAALLAVVAGSVAGSVAQAETITGKAAKKLLFTAKGAEVEILPAAGLAKDQAKVLELVGKDQPYYGAIAISPEEGLMSEATVAAANYHDTGAASAAALADCNVKKKKGAADCVVAALIRPKGWKDKGFQLSADATAGFKTYDAKTGALAISKSTGAWGIGAGGGAAEAAVAACLVKAPKAEDCTVVIAQ